jgi:hypothetical protein
VSLTVDDLAEHLNMPAARRPAEGDPRRREMQRALDTATSELTRMTGLIDGPASVPVRVTVTGRATRLPYVRLSAVTGAPGPVDLDAGLIDTAGVFGNTTVVVTCVRDEPWPAALETAALDWAAHVYETQRTTLNPTTDDDTALPSFALPNRVAQFAQPYLLPGIA